MDYKIPQPEGASELREPAVAYCPGIRTAEPWMANISDEPDDDSDLWDELDELYDGPPTAPDGRHWADWRYENDPEFRAFIDRRMDETDARIAAGIPGHTTDEVCDRILRCIETGNWDYYGLTPK